MLLLIEVCPVDCLGSVLLSWGFLCGHSQLLAEATSHLKAHLGRTPKMALSHSWQVMLSPGTSGRALD